MKRAQAARQLDAKAGAATVKISRSPRFGATLGIPGRAEALAEPTNYQSQKAPWPTPPWPQRRPPRAPTSLVLALGHQPRKVPELASGVFWQSPTRSVPASSRSSTPLRRGQQQLRAHGQKCEPDGHDRPRAQLACGVRDAINAANRSHGEHRERRQALRLLMSSKDTAPQPLEDQRQRRRQRNSDAAGCPSRL